MHLRSSRVFVQTATVPFVRLIPSPRLTNSTRAQRKGTAWVKLSIPNALRKKPTNKMR